MGQNILLENTQLNMQLLKSKNGCDKYDYLTSVACGAIGGLIDLFLVGTPGNSEIGNWTDSQVDNVVMKFARKVGWKPRAGNETNVNSAIGFLEGKYRINYDQADSSKVNYLFQMNTKNHHMLSLAHSPDVIGLFFSVLNQFTSTSTFITNGQLLTIATDTYELQGGNFIAKLLCGVANWFGHIMSDVAGSSGHVVRGSGVVIPFYELFGLCKFGSFTVDKARQDLATIAKRAFEEGYDLRHGLAMAIPVVVTDLIIRLIWALRRHFQYGISVDGCIPIPSERHEDLRMMLLLGNGILCIMDGVDAGIKSGGNFLAFFMGLNLIAWFRLVTLVLKEVCIRIGIPDALQSQLEAFKQVNEAMQLCLEKLKKIDYEAFRMETEKYNDVVKLITLAKTEEELNAMLLETYKRYGIKVPWEGDFDEFMSNPSNHLIYE